MASPTEEFLQIARESKSPVLRLCYETWLHQDDDPTRLLLLAVRELENENAALRRITEEAAEASPRPVLVQSPCDRNGHRWVLTNTKGGSFERGYFDNYYCSVCLANTQRPTPR